MPTFTVLMPIVRPPIFIPYAIASVLAQTIEDFELCIICDGAPWATIKSAQDAAQHDARIKVFPFPKGERKGEAHRHAILENAQSKYVCQIADDDLWFPNHLEEMSQLLSQVDFGNSLHFSVGIENQLFYAFADLSDSLSIVQMLTTQRNLFGPTACGYRLDTYRKLPVGWSPAPTDIFSDLFMWRKFLSLPDITLGTRFRLTSLHLGTSYRESWSLDQRVREIESYAKMVKSEDQRANWEQRLFMMAARANSKANARREYWQKRCTKAETRLKKSS